MNLRDIRRPAGRLFFCLWSLILPAAPLLCALPADQPARTVISDVLYRADGSPASGKLLISWAAFTTADGKPVAAGSLSATIGAGGAVSLSLVPTQGAQPAMYYKVVLKLDDGGSSTEYWTVPALSPTTIAAIRSQVVPQSVALQVVSREYVDGALNATVHKSGDETIAGIKEFVASPLVPTPSAAAQAANKDYVDAAVATGGGGNILALDRGGTNNSQWTASRCVRVANDGSKLESAASDCGSGSGNPDLSAPGPIGSTTPNSGTFTVLEAKDSVHAKVVNGILFADQYASLAAACSALSDAQGTVVISQPLPTVSANTTLPANCSLEVWRGGLITVSAGYTLKILGQVQAGRHQIFSTEIPVRVNLTSLNTASGVVTVVTAAPHNFTVGSTVSVVRMGNDSATGVTVTSAADNTHFTYTTTRPDGAGVVSEVPASVILSPVTFANNKQFEVYPDWWGNIYPDDATHDSQPGFQLAEISDGGAINFAGRLYYFGDALLIDRIGVEIYSSTWIRGTITNKVATMPSVYNALIYVLWHTSTTEFIPRHFRLHGMGGANFTGYGIYGVSLVDSTFHDLWFAMGSAAAGAIGGFLPSEITDSIFELGNTAIIGTGCSGTKIAHNMFWQTGASPAVSLTSCNDITIADNDFQGVLGAEASGVIAINTCTNINVSNNVFLAYQGAYGHTNGYDPSAVYVLNSSRINISGLIVEDDLNNGMNHYYSAVRINNSQVNISNLHAYQTFKGIFIEGASNDVIVAPDVKIISVQDDAIWTAASTGGRIQLSGLVDKPLLHGMNGGAASTFELTINGLTVKNAAYGYGGALQAFSPATSGLTHILNSRIIRDDASSNVNALLDFSGLTGDVYVNGNYAKDSIGAAAAYSSASATTYFGTNANKASDALWTTNGKFSTADQIISTLAIGTSPFSITSTTVNTNLNADMVDGKHASDFANTTHTHAESEVTNLTADLAAKQATAEKNAANGYAGLNASSKLAASQLPAPGASSLGGVQTKTCTGTDKLSAIGSDGVPVCSADQNSGGTPSLSAVTDLTGDKTFSDGNYNLIHTWTQTTAGPRMKFAFTWNDGATAFRGLDIVATDTASASGSTPFRVLGGAAGTTTLFAVNKNGTVTIGDGTADAITLAPRSDPGTPAAGMLYTRSGTPNTLRYSPDGSLNKQLAYTDSNITGTAAGLSATLGLSTGGTNQTSWTPSRCVRVNSGGTALESAGADCGAGAGTFIALSDTPSSYTGQGLKYVRVNSGETGLEFATPAGTGDVVTNPSSDQTIQATADATPLVVKQYNGTNSKDIFAVKDKTGAALLTVASDNSVTLGPGGTGSPGQLDLVDAGGTNYVGIVARSSVTTSYRIEPPDTPGSAGFRRLGAVSGGKSVETVVGETGSDNVVRATSPTITTPSFTTGFTIGGAAASGQILRGNGTNFVPGNDTRTVCYIAGGDNAAAALADTDDQADYWINDLGRTYRITRVWGQSDGGTPAINIARDDGTAANVLSASLTLATGNGACADSSAGSMTIRGGSITCSNTIQSAERDMAAGDGLNFVMVTAGGTAKRVTVCAQLVAQ